MKIRHAIHAAASYYGVAVEDIKGPSRRARFVEARSVAMYLAREHTGASYPQIAMVFNRHHSTVMHACQKVAQSVKWYPMWASRMAAILAQGATLEVNPKGPTIEANERTGADDAVLAQAGAPRVSTFVLGKAGGGADGKARHGKTHATPPPPGLGPSHRGHGCG